MAETAILYLLIGLCVAVAVFVSTDEIERATRGFQCATAVVFWPLYLPLLLSHGESSSDETGDCDGHRPSNHCSNLYRGRIDDRLAAAIAQVERELDAALGSLDGWADDVLSQQNVRIDELRAAWYQQAQRIREIDLLLARQDEQADERSASQQFSPDDAVMVANRRGRSEQARWENLRRLREIRRQGHDDLLGTLAWVRELVSMIHLAKFTGAPAQRAEQLVAQIAAAVEGISAVTWQEGRG